MTPRTLITAALAACALLAASCAEAPAPPPPPPPPVAPGIAFSPKLVELASAYRFYMVRATGISPAFADGPGVARSLQEGASYEPQQLVRGAIAYAALAALQDRAFVEQVRALGQDTAGRQQMTYELLKDPRYVLSLPGADGAAGLVVAALGGQGQALYDQGKAVKQSAYDLQRQAWSKQDVADRDGRLAGAKTLSSSAMIGDAGETARLLQASAGAPVMGLTAYPTERPYSPTVLRGLAIAALAALGQAGDDNVETILGLMVEPNVGSCMSSSKLNLYQCLAVARPNYEDIFCLGQHAMMDTGRCLIRAAGLPEPYEAKFVPSAESAARTYVVKKPPPPRKARRNR